MPPRIAGAYHHFSVDLEEYFQVVALEPYVARESWDRIPRRVRHGTDQLLGLLDDHRARATFFALSWVAEREPALIREIVAAGHELASHGTDHRRVTTLTPEEFRQSVAESKAVLEDVSGTRVIGYRAPSFSIVRGREWALEILVEEGYRYDSSLFPVRRPGYGFVGGQRDPHVLELAAGRLNEFPPATVEIAGLTLPAGGGAYFRLFPTAFVRSALTAAEDRGVPATFYIHPWELDPGQPRLPVSLPTRLRHYGNLTRTRERLSKLLSEFRFESIAATVGHSEDKPRLSGKASAIALER